MESIKYPLEGHLDLVLDCFYKYEKEIPESNLNPREEASVELDRVYLGLSQLEVNLHLTPQQWRDIEQWILEQRAWD